MLGYVKLWLSYVKLLIQLSYTYHKPNSPHSGADHGTRSDSVRSNAGRLLKIFRKLPRSSCNPKVVVSKVRTLEIYGKYTCKVM